MSDRVKPTTHYIMKFCNFFTRPKKSDVPPINQPSSNPDNSPEDKITPHLKKNDPIDPNDNYIIRKDCDALIHANKYN